MTIQFFPLGHRPQRQQLSLGTRSVAPFQQPVIGQNDAFQRKTVADRTPALRFSGSSADVKSRVLNGDERYYFTGKAFTAARYGNWEEFDKIMTERGYYNDPVLLNTPSEYGDSLLSQLAKSRDPGMGQVLEKLVQHGLLLNQVDRSGHIPYITAMRERNRVFLEVMKSFMDETLLPPAEKFQAFQEEASKYGIDLTPVPFDINRGDRYEYFPFLVALDSGDLETAQYLIKRFGDKLRCEDREAPEKEYGFTEIRSPLQEVLGYKEPEWVEIGKFILAHGGNKDGRGWENVTRLMNAASAQNIGMLKALMEAKADWKATDDNGNHVLMSAAEAVFAQGLDYLIREIKPQDGINNFSWQAFINHRNSRGMNTLLLALDHNFKDQTDQKEQLNCVTTLLENGADVNAPITSDVEGFKPWPKDAPPGTTPLMLAIRNNNMAAAEKILSHPQFNSLDAVDSTGKNAYQLALEAENIPMLALVVSRGGKGAGEPHQEPLLDAAQLGGAEFIRAALEQLKKEAGITEGQPWPKEKQQLIQQAFNLVLERDNPEEAKLLYTYGASLTEPNDNQQSPFMMAASKGHVGLLKWMVETFKQEGLLEQEINRQLPPTMKPPLTWAIESRNLEAVNLVADAGARLTGIQDAEGRTPLSRAGTITDSIGYKRDVDFNIAEAMMLRASAEDLNYLSPEGKTAFYEMTEKPKLFRGLYTKLIQKGFRPDRLGEGVTPLWERLFQLKLPNSRDILFEIMATPETPITKEEVERSNFLYFIPDVYMDDDAEKALDRVFAFKPDVSKPLGNTGSFFHALLGKNHVSKDTIQAVLDLCKKYKIQLPINAMGADGKPFWITAINNSSLNSSTLMIQLLDAIEAQQPGTLDTIRSKDGDTAVTALAARYGDFVVEVLDHVTKDHPERLSARDNENRNTLMLGLIAGHEKKAVNSDDEHPYPALEYCIDKLPLEDLLINDSDESSVLTYIAAYAPAVLFDKYMGRIQSEMSPDAFLAYVNQTDLSGKTALDYAMEFEKFGNAKKLVDAGAAVPEQHRRFFAPKKEDSFGMFKLFSPYHNKFPGQKSDLFGSKWTFK